MILGQWLPAKHTVSITDITEFSYLLQNIIIHLHLVARLAEMLDARFTNPVVPFSTPSSEDCFFLVPPHKKDPPGAHPDSKNEQQRNLWR